MKAIWLSAHGSAANFCEVDLPVPKLGPGDVTVDAVHESVKAFRPGDQVYSYVCQLSSSGAYAQYVCVPEELVAIKPARLTHEQAASVPVAARTATLALQRGSVQGKLVMSC